MTKKHSETSLGRMMRNNGYFVHKWRDRGFVSCPSCHLAITTCPYCKQSLLLPKAQTYPDFLVAHSWTFIECKQGTNDWNLYDVSDIQVSVLDDPSQISWIFLELGPGKAPKGKQAFLIEWKVFKEVREQIKREGYKSVSFKRSSRGKLPQANETFTSWQLEWATLKGWDIPFNHPWWQTTWRKDEYTTTSGDTTATVQPRLLG